MIYFLAMAVVYPFYAPGGYVRIGEVKYLFFRNVSLVVLAAAGGITLLTVLVRWDGEWIVKFYRRMSVTDWFAYGYLLTVLISYLCSVYKEDALLGTEGWYMGSVSQIIFVLIYFFFSRYYCCRGTGRKGLYLWLLAAAGVFALGICNRYSLYPIVMEGQTAAFISTLGNINWFCGYWSVTAPVGIMFYWGDDRLAVRIISGVYCLIAMLAGITQGSSSAYLVFLSMLFFLFVLSIRSNQKPYRFLELCMFFCIACQIGRWMRYLPGLSYNYRGFQAGQGSGITEFLIGDSAVAKLFLLLLSSYIMLHILEKKRIFCIGKHKWIRGIMAAAVLMTVCVAGFWMLVDDGVISFREVPGTVEQDGYLEAVVDEDWGNGRGATWKCGVDAYRGMDTLHKIVGIGPDCFADYIYDIPKLAERVIDRFGTLRLTNAHNEWLTILVNMGALGLLGYAGMLLTAFVRFLKKGREESLLYMCAAVLLAYTVHNMVSFQQVLSTPYMFMVLGMGEGLLKKMREGTVNNTINNGVTIGEGEKDIGSDRGEI